MIRHGGSWFALFLLATGPLNFVISVLTPPHLVDLRIWFPILGTVVLALLCLIGYLLVQKPPDQN